MGKKIRIGIDIDEVLRAKWIQFDKYYAIEFGEENIPENPYCFDYFNTYKWEEVDHSIKFLVEPDEMPELSVEAYITDENGNADADLVLFKSEQEKLTPRQVYNRFMYEDFLYDIFGAAPLMYKGLDFDFNKFHKKFKNHIEIVIVSNENVHSIPSTLSFLSRMLCRASNIHFTETSKEKWDNVDILISADPEILNGNKPFGKKLIKVIRPFNKHIGLPNMEVLQVNDLTTNNDFFKMVKWTKKDEEEYQKELIK